MDRANYFNNQRVTQDDLNYTESSKALALQNVLASLSARYTHLVTGSIPIAHQQRVNDANPTLVVANGVLGGMGSDYMTPAQVSATRFTVSRGWAITDDMDVIFITGSITMNQNDNSFTQRWVETSNATMWVVAEYQEASGSPGVDASRTTYYTRYTPSYRINVTASYPSGSNQVAIARFTGNAGAITINTFTDIRTYYRPWAAAESTIIKTPSVAQITNMEQHQAGIGHATPTTNNPHGTAIIDLGGIIPFVNGIYVMDKLVATTQSYSASIAPNTQLNFTVPSHATASVNGYAYTNTLAALSTTSPSSIGDGVYYVTGVANGSTLIPQFTPTASVTYDPLQPQLNPTLLFLGKAYVTTSAITTYTDLRNFYNQTPAIIRADQTEGMSNPSMALQPYNTLMDNLDRIRFQLGMALTGSGSNPWTTTSSIPFLIGGINQMINGSYPIYSWSWHGNTLPVEVATSNIGQPTSIKSLANQFSHYDGTTPAAYNVVYQNTYDHTIYVQATVNIGAADAGSVAVNLLVDSTNPPVQVIDSTSIANASNVMVILGANVHGFVPPNFYYMVAVFGSTGGTLLSHFATGSIMH